MEARKLAEGEASLKEAAKLLKPGGLFGRFSKPDHEAAAACYEKAAVAFRVAKAMPGAIEAFIKAAEEHEEFDSHFMSAKHLESAAFLAKDLRASQQAASLYERASTCHQLGGNVDGAAEALGKAARVVEEEDAARGAKLYTSACELYDDEEAEARALASLEIYKQCVAYLLRNGQRAAAATQLRKQALVHARVGQPHGVARCELSAVVALLAADDYDGALGSFDAGQLRGDGFGGSDESAAAGELLDAYARQDEEGLAATVGLQIFGFLDNQATRAAKSLTLKSCGVPANRLVLASSGGGGGGGSGGGGGGGGEGFSSFAPAAAAPAGAAPAASAPIGEGTGDFGEIAPEDEVKEEEEFTDDLC